jgi:hypothetical protein
VSHPERSSGLSLTGCPSRLGTRVQVKFESL